MRLQSKWSIAGAKPFSIANALESDLDGSDYGSGGALETIERETRNQSKFLGQLLQKLNERGVLSDADVLELLPGCWELV